MSSTVCQELQSFLKPTLIETCATESSAAAVFSAAANCQTNNTQNADIGGWTFLQSLTKTKDSAAVYVHPTEKRSTSMLSEKSLEICTESLGSETGSDISDGMSLLSMEVGSSNPTKPRKYIPKRINRNNSFPPPLSSISSSSGVQMVSHREGDRLVLQAVPLPSLYACFHAERADGRLKLSLLKEFDIEDEDLESEEDETEAETEAEAEAEEEEEENCGNCGVEEISRLSRGRCKEGGRGQRSILNWEPFWVAT